MELTDVRIMFGEGTNEKLLAFVNFTIDDEFVVHNSKIIKGEKGPFVCMPSERIMSRCPTCGRRNCLQANFCNFCGKEVKAPPVVDREGRTLLFKDVVHPITLDCRNYLNREILKDYRIALERGQERKPLSEEYDPKTYE